MYAAFLRQHLGEQRPYVSQEARLERAHGTYLTPLAVVVVVAAIVIIVTSGESIAVRYLVGLVSLDVAVRLVLWERGRQDGRV
jgi:hypothetical protein